MKFLRPLITLFYDAGVAALSFWGALMLRYDGNIPSEAESLLYYGASYALFCMSIFYLMSLHRNIWRYTSTRDLIHLGYAVGTTIVVTTGLIFLLTRLEHFPRSALVILFLLHVALSAAPRILMRVIHDRPFKHGLPKLTSNIKNVLLIDAGDAADIFIRECNRQHPKQYNICGILDDDKNKQGRSIHGIPVLGSVVNLAKIIDGHANTRTPIHTLVITDERPAGMSGFLDVAHSRKIAVKRLPNISQLEEGEKLTNLKPVSIEDLLGRDSIQTDMTAINNLVQNKVVFVTGAGGSIGSEICRQIAGRSPKTLIMADNSELALYQIDLEMTNTHKNMPQKKLLLDVKNSHDLKEAFASFKPDVIFHAAAYKHVPIVEDNPISGIENNLFGTANVADAAMANNIPQMVIISTDKAVNPTNVMGATKRAAEIYCQNLEGPTKITTVRFGNVLGSTGSVVPLFSKQIRNGGPITVTHKDVTRYFMTIPEAVQLVLQASTLGKSQEILMLDMGKPVRIWDMAEEMVRLSGLRPHEDIEIVEVGLRPGEKMFEELNYNEESMSTTEVDQVFLMNSTEINSQEIKEKFKALQKACVDKDNFQAVAELKSLVPEYQPSSNSPFAQEGTERPKK